VNKKEQYQCQIFKRIFEPVNRTMGQAITVLQDTWGFDTWVFFSSDYFGNEWSVSHVKTMGGFKLQIGDTVKSKVIGRFPLDEGFNNHIEPASLEIQGSRNVIIRGIQSHMLHVIYGETGQLFGAVLGLDKNEMPLENRQALPVISLISDMYVKTHNAYQSIVAERRRVDSVRGIINKDTVTELLNRQGWSKAVEAKQHALQKSGGLVTLLVFDIDGFKLINDKHGYNRGDDILATVGRTISNHVLSKDIASRIIGDEFAIIMTKRSMRTAVGIANSIKDALAIEGISISVGMVTVKGPAYDFENAYKRARDKMYTVKSRKRGAWV
tara:strand:- start:2573 stop:3550 length:978 start_codon:yes stop_codon:yes gene_type:complete